MTQTLSAAASTIAKAADDILDHGYAVVKLTDIDAGNLLAAISTAAALLCGVVWGLWIGFGIVAAGTFFGESKHPPIFVA